MHLAHFSMLYWIIDMHSQVRPTRSKEETCCVLQRQWVRRLFLYFKDVPPPKVYVHCKCKKEKKISGNCIETV